MIGSWQGAVGVVPFGARWPYQVRLTCPPHVSNMSQLDDLERCRMARALDPVELALLCRRAEHLRWGLLWTRRSGRGLPGSARLRPVVLLHYL